jgi:hypothetical protein
MVSASAVAVKKRTSREKATNTKDIFEVCHFGSGRTIDRDNIGNPML